MKHETMINCEWEYDSALKWMSQAKANVEQDKTKIFIGCGSHKKTVVTLGRNNHLNQVFLPKSSGNSEVTIKQLERGGGATGHEPGQLVFYPVLHLPSHGLGVRKFIELLEKATCQLLLANSINAKPAQKTAGIFVEERKVGFIGVRIKSGITQHGVALNVNNSQKIFQFMNPCGIKNLSTVSMSELLNKKLNLKNLCLDLSEIFLNELKLQKNNLL